MRILPLAIAVVALPVMGSRACAQSAPITTPGSRIAGLFAYDAQRDRLVLYGGTFRLHQGGVARSDPDPKTFMWSGDQWAVLASRGPRSRDEVAYGYDPRDGSVIMFGGRGQDAGPASARIPFRESWKLGDSVWTLVDTTGPSGRASPQGAFDASRGAFVVFGGRHEAGAADRFPSETWEWDGRAWKRFDVQGPSGRHGHVMAYDPKAKRVIMHGGGNASGALTDTWAWDGGRWQLVSQEGPRTLYGAATSGLDSGIVLFGGHMIGSSTNITWYWSGRVWTQIATSGPAARTFNAMTTDVRRRRIYMLGGSLEGGDNRETPNPELWVLDASNQWTQIIAK
jgi:hypothetical protein